MFPGELSPLAVISNSIANRKKKVIAIYTHAKQIFFYSLLALNLVCCRDNSMYFGFFGVMKELFLISLIDRTAGLWEAYKQWGGKSLPI